MKEKILIVEDNQINLKLALKMLEKLGLKADFAKNGLEAYEMTLEIKYDLIFMDVQMPVLDGHQATKKIIEHHQGKAPVIVALTANVFQTDIDQCYNSGMHDFLSKPISKLQLHPSSLQMVSDHN